MDIETSQETGMARIMAKANEARNPPADDKAKAARAIRSTALAG
ncbi:hypothetical protein [Tanticharoenia sakaeratensis]|jgi:hypothetical protein|nr:hypothetical protein [Tanticharoenia sakaeratensis]